MRIGGRRMDDLINRQHAIDALTDRSHQSAKKDGVDSSLWEGIMIARRIVKNLPSAQPEPTCYLGSPCEYQNPDVVVSQPERKSARWIPVTNGRGGHECSRCHDYAPSYQSGDEYLAKYCPNCGAKME